MSFRSGLDQWPGIWWPPLDGPAARQQHELELVHQRFVAEPKGAVGAAAGAASHEAREESTPVSSIWPASLPSPISFTAGLRS